VDWTGFLPAATIALREGTEAFLVVGIVLACINRAQQPQLRPWVYAGVAYGLLLSAGGGWLLVSLVEGIADLDPARSLFWRELWKGAIGLVAIAMLSWMLLWMSEQSKTLKSAVTRAVNETLTASSGWPLCLLVTLAVGREGLETVAFVLSQNSWDTSAGLGAIGGWIGAAVLVNLLLAGTVKINLGQFFKVMGVLLLLVVGGLVLGTMQHLDGAASQYGQLCRWNDGTVCNLGFLVWDWQGALPDDRGFGMLLKTLLGYRDRLYAGQLLAYVAFWGAIGVPYWRSVK
jgi:high-affinity iron transporter